MPSVAAHHRSPAPCPSGVFGGITPWATRTGLALAAGLAASLPAWAQPEEGVALVPSFKDYPVASVMAMLLFIIVAIMMLYGVRHFVFTMNRLTARQRHPYIDVVVANWPMITVFIAAHNE